MPLQAQIAVAGRYGLVAIIIVISWLFYDKSKDIADILLVVGILLAFVIVIIDLYIKYMDAETRRKDAETRSEFPALHPESKNRTI